MPVVVVLAITHAAMAIEGEARKAKNVIIMISDGGGFNTYHAATLYRHGRLGCEVYDRPEWSQYASRTASLNLASGSTAGSDYASGSSYMGSVGGYSGVSGSAAESTRTGKASRDRATYWDIRLDGALAASLSSGVPFKGYNLLRNSPTDSAAAGTAMASGTKTYNGQLNMVESSSSYDSSGETRAITEIAKALGKSTGIVTSVEWCDATPAAFGAAHNSSRSNKRDIASEMLNSGQLDLIMGVGHPRYDRNGTPRESRDSHYDVVGGQYQWELIQSGRHARGWKLVETRAEFEALMSGPTPARVLGVPRVSGTLQQERNTRDWNRDGTIDTSDMRYAPAFKDPFIKTVPSLVTMTRGALNVLGRNPKGFFAMIEGGAVDHAGHANQPGRLIEEQIDFNDSVRAVVDWVERNSSWDETLVIVTADHETGMLWGVNSDRVAFDPIRSKGAGRMPAMYFNSGSHTQSLVPLMARGPGASLFAERVAGTDPVHGRFVENTTIFKVMQAAINGAALDSGSYSPGSYGSGSYGSGSSYGPGSSYGSGNGSGFGSGYNGSSQDGSSYRPSPSTRPATSDDMD